MKKRLRPRSLITGAAVLCVSALALTGCTSGSSSDDASSGSLKTLTMMGPYLSTQAPPADNVVNSALEKVIGTKLAVTWVPNSSYEDKTNITLAGNEVPDVMVIQNKDAGFVNNAKAGAFWNLTDYLKDYPNLKTNEPQVQQASSVNGQVYGIFRARDVMRTAVMVRKDWLKKLGLSMPKTTADLMKVAKAFTDDDPDGDGKKDTYGIAIPEWPGGFATNSPYDAIETWFGAGNGWTLTNGKLQPSFMNANWIKALDYERKLVQSGYVNPDFATFDSVNWSQPFLSGKAGIIIDTYSHAAQINGTFEQTYPKTYQNMLAVTGNLIGPSGKMYALPTPGYSGFLAIPKASVQNVSKLKAVLSALNKMNSKQAQILMNDGIEGKNFVLKDGRASELDTPEAAQLLPIVQAYAQLGTNVTGNKYYISAQPNAYDQSMYDARLKLEASDTKSAVYNPAAAFVSETYVQQGTTLDNIILDARIKYIAGQDSLAQLKAAIQLWKNSGGSKVISETNALYKKSKK